MHYCQSKAIVHGFLHIAILACSSLPCLCFPFADKGEANRILTGNRGAAKPSHPSFKGVSYKSDRGTCRIL